MKLLIPLGAEGLTKAQKTYSKIRGILGCHLQGFNIDDIEVKSRTLSCGKGDFPGNINDNKSYNKCLEKPLGIMLDTR